MNADTTTSTTTLSTRGNGVGASSMSADLTHRFGAGFLTSVSMCVLAFLYAPIAVLIMFSFNDNRILSLPWRGFTWKWYEALFANADLQAAIWNSVYVGVFATFITILIGVPAAFALDRYNFPGKTVFRRFVLLPIALPGVITGVSMLNMFSTVGINLSLETVIMGHATALVSVVATQVFARLQRVNRSMEEASADLGAKPWQTFWYVTLPNIRSAIIGSALLSFTLSFDEIPVTFFLIGRDNTLPMYIWSTLRRGITPEINAVGTLIIIASLGLIILSVYLLRDDQKKG
ncbi:MAG: ABC transporter permease [Alphaproteobacteria bacterium]